MQLNESNDSPARQHNIALRNSHCTRGTKVRLTHPLRIEMIQAEALWHLQEIELNLLRHQKRLNEIATILGDDQAVLAAQTLLADAQKALVPLRTKARNFELEIQSNGQKAQQTEQQLYSGKVKNTKEMQDMQSEIAAL